jgi:hypothetical protein
MKCYVATVASSSYMMLQEERCCCCASSLGPSASIATRGLLAGLPPPPTTLPGAAAAAAAPAAAVPAGAASMAVGPSGSSGSLQEYLAAAKSLQGVSSRSSPRSATAAAAASSGRWKVTKQLLLSTRVMRGCTGRVVTGQQQGQDAAAMQRAATAEHGGQRHHESVWEHAGGAITPLVHPTFDHCVFGLQTCPDRILLTAVRLTSSYVLTVQRLLYLAKTCTHNTPSTCANYLNVHTQQHQHGLHPCCTPVPRLWPNKRSHS